MPSVYLYSVLGETWDEAMMSAMLGQAKEIFAGNGKQIVQAIQVVCQCSKLVGREGIFALEQAIEEDRLIEEAIPLKAFLLNIWRIMLSMLNNSQEEREIYINDSAELVEMVFNQVLVNRYQGCQAFLAYLYLCGFIKIAAVVQTSFGGRLLIAYYQSLLPVKATRFASYFRELENLADE